MLDPLTSLGLASNIVQFLSFSIDLISKSHEIYKSAEGTLVEYSELEAITEHLQSLSGGLSLTLSGSPKEQSKIDQELYGLSKGCRVTTRELLQALQRLKVEGKHKKWGSFRQALSAVWSQEHIQEISGRLEQFRRQINTTLLVSLREHIDRAEQKQSQHIERISKSVLRSIDETKLWQADLIDTIHRSNWRSQNENDVLEFSAKLSDTTEKEKNQLVRRMIINQLRFFHMVDRYESISEAYKKTFEWIFYDPEKKRRCETPVEGKLEMKRIDSDVSGETALSKQDQNWDNFVDWLHGDEGLYWVTGKPGSGKSTLMKFLYNDRRTLDNLQYWKPELPLVTAGFFFWNSGTTMQMSRMGLLQSLLHECLTRYPALIPQIFPDRWCAYQFFGRDLHPWTWPELTEAFKLLTSNASMRFFFFIDGLDEFDGKCSELAEFVIEISSSPNVKICTASRPWLDFEEAFENRPRLRLEQLTSPDIKLYVSEKLHGHARFVDFERVEPLHAPRLITDVTKRASGVFLWVRLVVQSLLGGLRDGDNISDLQKKLLTLPPDLEKLFKKILDRLNPLYFEQASVLFQCVRAASEPITLLGLSFAEGGFDTAMEAEIKPLGQAQLAFQAETMRRRLLSRCEGFIEAPWFERDGANTQVQYLHRTVRDFFKRREIWEYIRSGTQESFDPFLSLAGAYLHDIKTRTSSDPNLISRLWFDVGCCVTYSGEAKDGLGETYVRFFDELDKAASIVTKRYGGASQDETLLRTNAIGSSNVNKWDSTLHWTTSHVHAAKLSPNITPGNPQGDIAYTSFLDFAYQVHLGLYVDFKFRCLNQVPFEAKEELLFTVIRSLDVSHTKLLLENGVGPNKWRHGASWTAWHEALLMAQQDTNPPDPQKMSEIISLLIEHGANPDITVCSFTPDETIEDAFRKWNSKRTGQLLTRIKAARKKAGTETTKDLGSYLGIKPSFGQPVGSVDAPFEKQLKTRSLKWKLFPRQQN